MKTVHVKNVSAATLSEKWNVPLGIILRTAGGICMPVIVRCNKKGEINWDKTCQYSLNEVIGKANFKYISNH